MNIVILYGTESGNAELVADEVSEALEASGHGVSAEIVDMSEAEADVFDIATLYLVICSTHGEGELPSGAQPFAEMLDAERPDLAGVRYAMFGLGDSTYDHYSRGSEHIDERLSGLGATRVGDYGRHDASSRDDASELAIAWAESVLEQALLAA